jgi:hypothetical protein
MTDVRGLYRGLQRIKLETELKIREIQRYARVSFVLNVQNEGSVDVLSLERVPEYSRCQEPLPICLLGLVESAGASRPRLIQVGKTLCRVLAEHETPPRAGLKQWRDESFDGDGKPLVPVAIYGTDYFHRHGLVAAPETYRTNDPVSQEFLRQLKG